MHNCPTIFHLNDCSIFVCISSLRFAVLGTVSYIYEFDIICVTKTWLKSSNNLRFPGFVLYSALNRIAMEAELLNVQQSAI